MKTLFVLIALFAFDQIAFARVGETRKEIETRYGKHVQHIPESPSEMECWVYQKDDLKIKVFFDKSARSTSEIYIAPEKLSPDTVKALLEANKGASDWIGGETQSSVYNGETTSWAFYTTKDRSREARWYAKKGAEGEKLVVSLQNSTQTVSGF